ncbi:MAG: hypothetical protein K0R93_1522 [Anaerosolibacter sp.]|jgi:hypothetical protein|uniref:hypothetical protein n=1 Tax=Anaerosolibacter sp. TaxID=1872527 RepID=UPI0026039FA8|nr:hypothetical protein [Anaerosolibacter sp.]MDF2546624.1 hypothetical protein [Anaerosolibacter sp.]
MASKEQLHAVASLCSEYSPVEGSGLTSSAQYPISCENCGHFTKEHKCDIDLVDEILVDMDQT